MNRYKQAKHNFYFTIVMLFVLSIGIGYAVLSERLTIDNTISYDSMKWDIGFTSAEDGFDSYIDAYIEWIESEYGSLEELGITREDVEQEIVSDSIYVTPTATVSSDKKLITVNCNLEKSSKEQLSFVKATISNASTFNVAISDLDITYDDTYIYADIFWLNHSFLESGSTMYVGQILSVGESAEVMLLIATRELTEDMLPSSDLSLPITISLNFEESEIDFNQIAMLQSSKTIGYDATFYSNTYQSKIKNITFEDIINVPEDAVESWDIGVHQNGNVMSYIVPNENDSTYYDLYIQSDKPLYANFDMSDWFGNFLNVDSINGLELLDTSLTNDMSRMFWQIGYNSTVFTLDVSNFDTSNVTDMSGMFGYVADGGNNTVFTLDVSNFDTSNVTNMNMMFIQTATDSTAITLDVSNFDTSNVTDMGWMFSCIGYNNPNFTLDVSNFDTSNVTNMNNMFNATGYNSTVFTLDVSNFDTSNVTDMGSMFSSTGRKSTVFTLDVSNFDTSNVTNMNNMFNAAGYNSTKFNTSITIKNPNTTSYDYMFENVATKTGSKITVNYTSETSDLVDLMIATKSSNSNVVKGVQVD